MAVIRDVAEKAGVAISTVSKYLNHPEDLTHEYRLKVEKAIAELNYKPSSIARRLRNKRTNFIAVIVPDVANAFYSEVFNAIRTSAVIAGYTPILYTTDDNLDVLNEYFDNIDNLHADGIILCFLDEDELMNKFNKIQTKIPITLLSWDIENIKYNSVIIHLSKCIYQTTKHITEIGKKRIAYIGGPADSRISKEKLRGFQKALEESDVPIYPEYLISGRYRFQAGYQNAGKLMQLPNPPDAIVCANDVLAIGTVKYLKHMGLKVPEDVAVVGCDGIQLSYLFDPSITTVTMPIQEMCHSAVSLLANKIERPGSKNRQIIFDTELVVRRSTKRDAPLIIDL